MSDKWKNSNECLLIQAAMRQDVDMVKILLWEGKVDVNKEVKGAGPAPLMCTQNVEIVKLLLKHGADVNQVDDCGMSALHESAQRGNLEIVKVLIQNGANVNMRAGDFFYEKPPLHLASQEGHVDIAKVLIQNGVDVNELDAEGITAIGYAVTTCHLDVAKVLVRNGAKLDIGHAPILSYAVGWTPGMLYFVCLGAKIDSEAVRRDATRILGMIERRLELLCDGKRIADLYSKEEGIFMWYLAFTLAMKCRVAGRRAFYVIRSLITFNGIFMAPGFDLGKGSLWRFHTNHPGYTYHC